MSSLEKHSQKIIMAPMEGVIDATMREMYSAIGGVDRFVSEFVRISSTLLPNKVFYRYCPELQQGGKTLSGSPVYLQILGDNPTLMAESAAKAASLGAAGIDINFGCPAKTVNNHGGGSAVLQYPEKVANVVEAVAKALPKSCPLTVKMRLGYKDKNNALELAQAIEQSGAQELAIHARTKTQGYKPPAYWQDLAIINQTLKIPVVANGEIWTLHDLKQCQAQSTCSNIMLGRGLVACPDLALMAKGINPQSINFSQILILLEHYFYQLKPVCPEKYLNNLIKQWLIYLRMQYGEAHLFFETIKKLRDTNAMLAAIKQAQTKQPAVLETLGGLQLSGSQALQA